MPFTSQLPICVETAKGNKPLSGFTTDKPDPDFAKNLLTAIIQHHPHNNPKLLTAACEMIGLIIACKKIDANTFSFMDGEKYEYTEEIYTNKILRIIAEVSLEEVMRTIIDLGFDVNTKNIHDQTLLQLIIQLSLSKPDTHHNMEPCTQAIDLLLTAQEEPSSPEMFDFSSEESFISTPNILDPEYFYSEELLHKLLSLQLKNNKIKLCTPKNFLIQHEEVKNEFQQQIISAIINAHKDGLVTIVPLKFEQQIYVKSKESTVHHFIPHWLGLIIKKDLLGIIDIKFLNPLGSCLNSTNDFIFTIANSQYTCDPMMATITLYGPATHFFKLLNNESDFISLLDSMFLSLEIIAPAIRVTFTGLVQAPDNNYADSGPLTVENLVAEAENRGGKNYNILKLRETHAALLASMETLFAPALFPSPIQDRSFTDDVRRNILRFLPTNNLRNILCVNKKWYTLTKLQITEQVKNLISKNYQVKTSKSSYYKDFCEAIASFNPFHIALKLIQQEFLINKRGELGQTLLHFFTQINCKDAIQLFINNGADIWAQDNWGKTPIEQAISSYIALKGRKPFPTPEIIQLFIQTGYSFASSETITNELLAYLQLYNLNSQREYEAVLLILNTMFEYPVTALLEGKFNNKNFINTLLEIMPESPEKDQQETYFYQHLSADTNLNKRKRDDNVTNEPNEQDIPGTPSDDRNDNDTMSSFKPS